MSHKRKVAEEYLENTIKDIKRIKDDRKQEIKDAKNAQFAERLTGFSNLVKEASYAGKSTVEIGIHYKFIIQYIQDTYKDIITITKRMGYNPSSHDDMICGYTVSW